MNPIFLTLIVVAYSIALLLIGAGVGAYAADQSWIKFVKSRLP